MRPSFFLIFLMIALTSPAQYTFEGYLDAGHNNVSSGMYGKPALVSAYQYKFITARTGLEWTFPVRNDRAYPSWIISTKADFHIRKAKFEGGAFYLHVPFSPRMREHQWGFWLGFNSKHFTIQAGNNTRIMKFTARGQKELGLNEDDDLKITEPRNLMYRLTAYVKPRDHYWNVSIYLTDFDDFLIQQETNPMVGCRYIRELKKGVSLYGDLRYQSAGWLNLAVNYFGINFRSGVLWKIK